VPIHAPVDDPYASLTPAKLAAFGINPARSLDDDNNDDEEEEEAANNDEEIEDDN
jgi:hypothetical protein